MKKALSVCRRCITAFIYHDFLFLTIFSSCISVFFIEYFYEKGLTLAYGDAESHLNIAKRVIDSVTPGFAQLGGVWLPLPHLLMIPFIISDVLWQTGIGGAIISGICFVVSSLFIYKIIFLITKTKVASVIGFFVFISNANVLYMQATPMSELSLIVFFVLSLYSFFIFLQNDENILSLVYAGFFGFCATLCRYDGWFLVLFELFAIIFFYGKEGIKNHIVEGKVILFSTIAFFGIFLWLLWNKLILGDAFYFSNSPFSATSQQKGWMIRGELPAYKNIFESFLYYLVTSFENIGIAVTTVTLAGLLLFLFDVRQKNRFIITILLFVPFIFYVTTLFLGESVIFIPLLTPHTYQWRLFNVRYGMMMLPTAAVFVGYIASRGWTVIKGLFLVPIILQSIFFLIGISPVVTIEDGVHGLSAASHPNAQYWMRKNYNGGLVLLDDYARTISITQSKLPIKNVIYVGNKPYWQEALNHPEKYVQWVVLQKGDAVWSSLYSNPLKQKELYKYFVKVYTSPTILIFKRNVHSPSLDLKEATPLS